MGTPKRTARQRGVAGHDRPADRTTAVPCCWAAGQAEMHPDGWDRFRDALMATELFGLDRARPAAGGLWVASANGVLSDEIREVMLLGAVARGEANLQMDIDRLLITRPGDHGREQVAARQEEVNAQYGYHTLLTLSPSPSPRSSPSEQRAHR